jgi:glycosyltransferase involved in cell wall biosynthesis
MIDIAMLTCNRARITEISIREIAARTVTPYRLHVVDNGSVDGTRDVLTDLWGDGLIHSIGLSDENNGVHWGFNELLKMATGPFYVCTDPDIVPPSPTEDGDWLARLLALTATHPGYAAIACRPHVMIGDNVERMFAGAPEVVQRDHVGAVLRLMRTAEVRNVGGWRKVKHPSRNNEEWYICGQLRKAGWAVGYARDIPVIHLFGDPGHGEDPWGYPQGVEHGHKDRWPPVNHYSWERMGIGWETCQRSN